jgi:MFS family permease
VAIVLLALSPDFVLSTALGFARPVVAKDLSASAAQVSWASTWSNAALALGAVIAADLAQRVGNRPLYWLFQAMFILGSLAGMLAPGRLVLIGGHVLQGLSTGLLLVVTLPPLFTGFPLERLKTTIPAVVIGLFGAVTAGPMVGGYVAQTDTWRLLFGLTAVLGLVALVLSFFVLPAREPLNPGARLDASALALSAAGVGLAFYGAGGLESQDWSSPRVYVPVALGCLALVSLIVLEIRRRDPLMPTRPLTTTFPVMGILTAIISGAAFTGVVQLMNLFLQSVQGMGPLAGGILFWPQLATGLLGAFVVGAVLTTRWVLALPLFGMISLAVAAWLLTGVGRSTSSGEILWISGLLGLGASLTVTPGLLMAALSVVPAMVGRAVALVELLRLFAAYVTVPVLVYFARIYGSRPHEMLAGLHTTFWVSFGMLVGGIVLITLVYVASGANIHPPGLDAYLERGEPALESPPISENRGPKHR